MSDEKNAESKPDGQELTSAMFMSLVMQQTNMASIFLGLRPNPQTNEMTRDLDHAQYFIDQLEMLEAKTKGNLDKHEEGLLKNSLTSLRMAFVEAVSKPAEPAAAAPAKSEGDPASAHPAPAPSEGATAQTPPESGAAPAAGTDDSRKKFTKKY